MSYCDIVHILCKGLLTCVLANLLVAILIHTTQVLTAKTVVMICDVEIEMNAT